MPAGFVKLMGLSDAPLANALTQLSGETATGSQQTTFDAMNQFMGVMTDPFMDRTGGAIASQRAGGYTDEALGYANSNKKTDAFAGFTKAPQAPAFEQRWSVWAAGFGGSQTTGGNTALGSNNTTSNIAATAIGADYRLSPNTLLGFALAGGGTNFSVANGGTGRSDLFQVGAHVRHNQGPAYISAALAYGWQDITTDRTITASGDHLRAEFNANAWSGRLEGGYRFVSPATSGIGITPYAAAQFVTFDLPSYAEQASSGSSQFELAYDAKDVTDVRSELGLRTDKSFAMPNGILTLRGRFAWAHDFDPDRSISATFQSLPGAALSSTARRKRPIPRSPRPRSKLNGGTAGRQPRPSRASSPTSQAVTPERASFATRGDLRAGTLFQTPHQAAYEKTPRVTGAFFVVRCAALSLAAIPARHSRFWTLGIGWVG